MEDDVASRAREIADGVRGGSIRAELQGALLEADVAREVILLALDHEQARTGLGDAAGTDAAGGGVVRQNADVELCSIVDDELFRAARASPEARLDVTRRAILSNEAATADDETVRRVGGRRRGGQVHICIKPQRPDRVVRGIERRHGGELRTRSRQTLIRRECGCPAQNVVKARAEKAVGAVVGDELLIARTQNPRSHHAVGDRRCPTAQDKALIAAKRRTIMDELQGAEVAARDRGRRQRGGAPRDAAHDFDAVAASTCGDGSDRFIHFHRCVALEAQHVVHERDGHTVLPAALRGRGGQHTGGGVVKAQRRARTQRHGDVRAGHRIDEGARLARHIDHAVAGDAGGRQRAAEVQRAGDVYQGAAGVVLVVHEHRRAIAPGAHAHALHRDRRADHKAARLARGDVGEHVRIAIGADEERVRACTEAVGVIEARSQRGRIVNAVRADAVRRGTDPPHAVTDHALIQRLRIDRAE